MTYNWVDYILLAVLLISILGGLARGGVREILSLVTWIAAFTIAGLFAKPLAAAFSGSHSAQSAMTAASTGNFAQASDQVSLLALSVSFCALFFGTIIIGSLIGYFANRVVEGGGISLFNRLLGGIFGLGRGYLIDLLIIFLVQLSSFSQENYWTNSVVVNKFQPAVQWLGNKVQPGFESLKSRVGQTLENMSNGVENSVMGVYQKN